MKNAVAFGLICLVGCSGESGETCGTFQCAVGSSSYQACTGGSACRYVGSDGTSFSCASCADCGAAVAAIVDWCANGPMMMSGGDLGGNVQQPMGDLARPMDLCSMTSPRSAAPIVSVLPDDGEAPFVATLSQAQRSIVVMVYLMGFGAIMDNLKSKAAAGVSVRVILHDDRGPGSTNQKYYDMLTAAGIQVKWSDPAFPYMHAKYILVDGTEALITTGNFSTTFSIEKERNFVARITDPNDVADMASLFEADWNNRSPDLSCTRLLVSPVNAKARLLELIAGAQRTLDIESMQFADDDIRAAVAARATGGVSVRALLAAPSWIDANADAAAFLKMRGVPVKYMSNPGVHVKAIIVDGERVFIGSENISYTSLAKNREVGVVMTEPSSLAPIKTTFERDWTSATPFP